MASQSAAPRSTTFTLGWIALLVISTLAALNHLLIFIFQERELFLGWAAFNIYSTLVLALPFRRREPWAWAGVWHLTQAWRVAGILAGALYGAMIRPVLVRLLCQPVGAPAREQATAA